MIQFISTLLVIMSAWTMQVSTTIEGKVTDDKTGEPIIFGAVKLFRGEKFITGSETDIDGNYFFSSVQPGIYDIEVEYVGYTIQRQTNIVISAGRTNRINFKISNDENILKDIQIMCYHVPLIEIDNTTQGSTVISESIRSLPTKSVDAIAATSAGISVRDVSDISVRGSRSTETVYFLDGVRIVDKVSLTDRKAEPVVNNAKAGLVTAGEWNDLNNWDKWSDLLKSDEYKDMNKYWGIYTQNRFPVFITNKENKPISGVSLSLTNKKDSILWKAISDVQGRAELYDLSKQSYNQDLMLKYEYLGIKSKIPIKNNRKGKGINLKLNTECSQVKKVNISFVVDATGSMGDELNYLKSDLASVIQAVESQNKNADISYSSVFYQDIGDSYVTRNQNFTSEADSLMSFINRQSLGGGGDFPEAVDSALISALYLSWDKEAEVKLLFLILDAPPHLELIDRYTQSIKKAASMGIKIIPITASGIDRQTEFLMKFTAILTNATYAFITDHSGIGGEHLAPVHDEYNVEKLNDLIVRVINGYLYSIPCSATDAATIQDVTISPNPAKHEINIDFHDTELPVKIEVLSSTGKILFKIKETSNGISEANISNLISGQYYLKLTYTDKVLTKSFIKIE